MLKRNLYFDIKYNRRWIDGHSICNYQKEKYVCGDVCHLIGVPQNVVRVGFLLCVWSSIHTHDFVLCPNKLRLITDIY